MINLTNSPTDFSHWFHPVCTMSHALFFAPTGAGSRQVVIDLAINTITKGGKNIFLDVSSDYKKFTNTLNGIVHQAGSTSQACPLNPFSLLHNDSFLPVMASCVEDLLVEACSHDFEITTGHRDVIRASLRETINRYGEKSGFKKFDSVVAELFKDNSFATDIRQALSIFHNGKHSKEFGTPFYPKLIMITELFDLEALVDNPHEMKIAGLTVMLYALRTYHLNAASKGASGCVINSPLPLFRECKNLQLIENMMAIATQNNGFFVNKFQHPNDCLLSPALDTVFKTSDKHLFFQTDTQWIDSVSGSQQYRGKESLLSKWRQLRNLEVLVCADGIERTMQRTQPAFASALY